MRALNQDAAAMYQPVRYPLPEGRRIQWGKLAIEVLLWITPWLSAALLATAFWAPEGLGFLGIRQAIGSAKPLLLIILGVSWILRTWFRYRDRGAAAGAWGEGIGRTT